MLHNRPIKTTTQNEPQPRADSVLMHARRIIRDKWGIDCDQYARLWQKTQDVSAETAKAASVCSEPAPLTPHTLAVHQEAWATRIGRAQELKNEALALQSEALAKLQEAQALLQAASVTPTLCPSRRDTTEAHLQECNASIRRVHSEMPPRDHLAAFGFLPQLPSARGASVSHKAPTSQVSTHETCLDDYDFVDEALQSWSVVR